MRSISDYFAYQDFSANTVLVKATVLLLGVIAPHIVVRV
jgi:hypothetical protein